MLNEESGAALMMAIFTVTMLMIIATEIMYETSVEFVVSSQTVNRVKAHYAAKAGVEISLLRLHIYRKAVAAMGEEAAQQLPLLDMMWTMPFSWPPHVPGEASRSDREEVKAKVKSSKMDSQYLATIESEGNKIDLTTLASENEKLRNATMNQIIAIFEQRMQDDQKFANKHSGEDWRKLANSIKDWVDPDDKNDMGGEESSAYRDLGEAGRNLPPNRPFMTFEELHMVSGMTDEYYKMLLPRVTIYGTKVVNIKYASRDVLKTLFALTDEQVRKLMDEKERKDSNVFKNEQSFYQFLQSLGVRTEQFKDQQTGKFNFPIRMGPEHNFRIKSTGIAGKVQTDITAIVYDYQKVLAQMKSFGATPSPSPATTPPPGATPTPTPNPTPAPAGGQPVPNESPWVVYWSET
jgi:general secretion pathway protein K